MGLKKCAKCNVQKTDSIDEFGPSKQAKCGLNSWCRPCVTEYRKTYIPKPKLQPKEGHKICSKCMEEQAFLQFKPNAKIKSGLHSWCKKCCQTGTKNKPRKTLLPREGHRICTLCETEKLATLEFFHKLKKGKDGLNARCKNCENEKTRKWSKNNPERVLISSRKTNAKRKDKINAYQRIYYETKQNKDPFWRACRNIRKRAKEILKTGQISKTIGCSGKELKKHLESLFQLGMSWENYGEWHIDHKYPLSLAHAEGSESFKKACHYTNLQPLWAKDNLKKGNRV